MLSSKESDIQPTLKEYLNFSQIILSHKGISFLKVLCHLSYLNLFYYYYVGVYKPHGTCAEVQGQQLWESILPSVRSWNRIWAARLLQQAVLSTKLSRTGPKTLFKNNHEKVGLERQLSWSSACPGGMKEVLNQIQRTHVRSKNKHDGPDLPSSSCLEAEVGRSVSSKHAWSTW